MSLFAAVRNSSPSLMNNRGTVRSFSEKEEQFVRVQNKEEQFACVQNKEEQFVRVQNEEEQFVFRTLIVYWPPPFRSIFNVAATSLH